VRDPGRVLILGAGPTGLGAASRLLEAGHPDWLLLEASDHPGGLAASFVDPAGFTWDLGGHVQFSHYARYDAALDRALGERWLWHERESWVWIRGRFVPYPFQNNLHRLPDEERDRCLAGLERALERRGTGPVANFGEWIDRTFGEGIAELFLRPYNEKVWGYPPERLDTGWMGDRVALPDVERIRANVAAGRDDVSWGPNRRFRFPLQGGTGAIWRAVAGRLPAERMRYGARAVSLDLAGRALELANGERLRFDALVSAVPLDELAAMTPDLAPAARAAARRLLHSAVHVVGIGLSGERPRTLERKCWMYFPEQESPYFRVTVFSNYSPHHVPTPDCWSLMTEVSETDHRAVDGATLVARVEEALARDGLVPAGARVESRWHRREPHGYPTPFLGRDEVLAAIVPAFERAGVLPRGRFGAWRYEVSNQDHAYMQGVEAVERLLGVGDEPTLGRSDWVNSGALAAPTAAAAR